MKRTAQRTWLVLTVVTALAAMTGGSRPARGDGPFAFYSVPLCTIFDTTSPSGPTGGQPLAGGTTYNFTVKGHCGVPSGAQLAMLELVAVNPTGAGFLRVFQAGTGVPPISTLNYPYPIGAIAIQVPISLAVTTPDISINPAVAGSVHVICSVSGYFQ
jgi:hypothetical protein